MRFPRVEAAFLVLVGIVLALHTVFRTALLYVNTRRCL